MNVKKIEINTINKLNFKYIYLHELSRIALLPYNQEELNIDNIIEGRLFSESMEVHIIDGQAFMITENDDDHYIDVKYSLNSKNTIGKRIVVRCYINYDDDGQAYIELTRLKGVE